MSQLQCQGNVNNWKATYHQSNTVKPFPWQHWNSPERRGDLKRGKQRECSSLKKSFNRRLLKVITKSCTDLFLERRAILWFCWQTSSIFQNCLTSLYHIVHSHRHTFFHFKILPLSFWSYLCWETRGYASGSKESEGRTDHFQCAK